MSHLNYLVAIVISVTTIPAYHVYGTIAPLPLGPNRAFGCQVRERTSEDILEFVTQSGLQDTGRLVDGCTGWETGTANCCFHGSSPILVELKAFIKVRQVRLYGGECSGTIATDDCKDSNIYGVLLTNKTYATVSTYVTDDNVVSITKDPYDDGIFDFYFSSPVFTKGLVVFRPASLSMKLCEVQVFGDCLGENFGNGCQFECHCSAGAPCQPETGLCDGGCENGWLYTNCSQQCPVGRYGQQCTKKCTMCIENECNVANGYCKLGCQKGRFGFRCINKCLPGFYGYNCEQECGHCNSVCEIMDGHCETECEVGWHGLRCEKKCGSLMYGQNCSMPCGYCRDDAQCHYVTGVCEEGCQSGWTGDQCLTTCAEGLYGANCAFSCTGCNDQLCDSFTGTCQFSSCAPGWHGVNCRDQCPPSRYGQDCEARCDTCLDGLCEGVGGTCVSGCRAGFIGHKCDVPDEKQNWYLYTFLPIGVIIVIVIAVLVIISSRRRTLHRTHSSRSDNTMHLSKI